MNAGRTVRIGTRASILARTQTETVGALLRSAGYAVELVEISTRGDRSAAPIEAIGGVGVFTSALREALLAGRIDVAVHSFKDLPSAADSRLTVAAVPRRVDPRDVLVTRDGRALDELPTGTGVSTGAPRRIAELRTAYPDLRPVPIRGNVDSRIAIVASGRAEAVVLAAAGLMRLGLIRGGLMPDEPIGASTAVPLGDTRTMARPISTDIILPAPAQGALAVECRVGSELVAALGEFDHYRSRAAVVAERALLAALQAGCTAPIGALAEIEGDALTLTGALATGGGGTVVRRTGSGLTEDAAGIGQRVAADLVRTGVPDPLGSTP